MHEVGGPNPVVRCRRCASEEDDPPLHLLAPPMLDLSLLQRIQPIHALVI